MRITRLVYRKMYSLLSVHIKAIININVPISFLM